MGSIKEPKRPDLRMPWTFIIIFGLIAVTISGMLPEPYDMVFIIIAGLSARRLGLALPKFYVACKISLNNWLKK